MTTRTERLEAALRNLVGWAESIERRVGVRMGDANTGALVAAQDVLAESGPSCCEETRERTLEEAAKHVEAHSCVSSCCDAQPSDGEAKSLASCLRAISNQAPVKSDFPSAERLADLEGDAVVFAAAPRLMAQANGEEKKEGVPEPDDARLRAFGARCAQRAIESCRHSGRGRMHDNPTLIADQLLLAPPTTPPRANKETLSLIHDWTLGGATNPAPVIPVKPACKNPDCVNGWVQVGTGTPSGEGGEDWSVEACSDCGGEEP